MPMKTPGVYVVEEDAFPNAVVEVATAVPAFIGYTEKHEDGGKELLGRPCRITSMVEYERCFGGAPELAFVLGTDAPEARSDAPSPAGGADPALRSKDGTPYYVSRDAAKKVWHLYHSMKLFFQNGGGPCWVVSVGTYSDELDQARVTNGINALGEEQEPTMVVIPDAVLFTRAGCAAIQNAALDHCHDMTSRFAILDVFRGWAERTTDTADDCVIQFRQTVGISPEKLKWGAAYYPWVDTSAVQLADISFRVFADRAALQDMLHKARFVGDMHETPRKQQQFALIEQLGRDDLSAEEQEILATALTAVPEYMEVLRAVQAQVNLLPPSGAMAGIYTLVDSSRGVWKAPANVGLAGVIRPHVDITHEEQEDLNVTPTGKSVNAIRLFIGEGVLVWGARTLDGNSLDWRYVNVRRTMIMLEQSIKLACRAYVFEANDSHTWITIKSMIRRFLTGIWRRGGLAGFSVHAGLGETMTPEDLLEGILRVTVLVAPTRPAEFIELTFQQQMEKS